MKLIKKRPALGIMIVGLDNSGKTSILNYLTSLNSRSTSSSPTQQEQFSSQASDNKISKSSSSDTRSTESSIKIGSGASNAGNKSTTTPTIGYNYERIQYKGLTFTALDFSGQNRYRNLWQEFYNCVDAIVFVIDSSDLIRLVVVRDELETLLSHPYFGTLLGDDNSTISGNSSQVPLGAQKQIVLTSQGKLIQSPIDSSASASQTSILAPSTSHGRNNTPLRRQRIKIPILFLANKCDLANSVDIEVIVKALNLNQLPKNRHPWLITATSIRSNPYGIMEGFDWLVSQL